MYMNELIIGCITGIILLTVVKLCFCNSHIFVNVYFASMISLICITGYVYYSDNIYENLIDQLESIDNRINKEIDNMTNYRVSAPPPEMDIPDFNSEDKLEKINKRINELEEENNSLSDEIEKLKKEKQDLLETLVVIKSDLQKATYDIDNVTEDLDGRKIYLYLSGIAIPLFVGLKDEIKQFIFKFKHKVINKVKPKKQQNKKDVTSTLEINREVSASKEDIVQNR